MPPVKPKTTKRSTRSTRGRDRTRAGAKSPAEDVPGMVALSKAQASGVAADWLIERELLILTKDGRLVVNGRKLHGLSATERAKLAVQCLEGQMMLGSAEAAKAVLAHHRWAEEMENGSPGKRLDVNVSTRPALRDDLGTRHDHLPDTQDVVIEAAKTVHN